MGQGEVDVARTADVSVVVTVPGTGDDVQALKAGVMEIADIFVVNKADREGADRAVAEIQAVLALQDRAPDQPAPPVLKTEAARGEGVAELRAAIDTVGARDATRRHRRRSRARVRLHQALTRQLVERLEADDEMRSQVGDWVDRIARGEVDPYTAAHHIMEQV